MPGLISVNTKNLDAKRKRIDKLPQYYLDAVKAHTKYRAYQFIKEWQKNIRMDALSVVRLKKATINRKTSQGMKKPDTPLYGLGDSDPHTYINMMRIYALKNGYKVGPGRKGHHKSKLKLRDLFVVHEYGTTIQRGETTIRIPARPTFFLSYQRFLAKDAQRFKSVRRQMMLAAREMIVQGKHALFQKIHSRYGVPKDKDE